MDEFDRMVDKLLGCMGDPHGWPRGAVWWVCCGHGHELAFLGFGLATTGWLGTRLRAPPALLTASARFDPLACLPRFLSFRPTVGMVTISEVTSGSGRETRTAAHTHIQGLGLKRGEDGAEYAEKVLAGFVGQESAREVASEPSCCAAPALTHW